MKQWRSLTPFRRLRRCLTPYQLSKAFFRPAMIWSPFVMKCIVSSSNKRITCRIPTALGTCTIGSWWHVWAALFCPAEGSFATSSSTWEGESPFHLLCSLSLYLSCTVCCSYVSHPLSVVKWSCRKVRNTLIFTEGGILQYPQAKWAFWSRRYSKLDLQCFSFFA